MYPVSTFFINQNDPAGTEKGGWNMNIFNNSISVYSEDKFYLDLLTAYQGEGVEEFKLTGNSEKNKAVYKAPWNADTLKSYAYSDSEVTKCGQAVEILNEGFAAVCDGTKFLYGFPQTNAAPKIFVKDLTNEKVTGGCKDLVHSRDSEVSYVVCN